MIASAIEHLKIVVASGPEAAQVLGPNLTRPCRIFLKICSAILWVDKRAASAGREVEQRALALSAAAICAIILK